MRTPDQSRAAYTYLRPKDVAQRLGCSRATVLRLVRNGVLDAIDIGLGKRPTYRISQEAVEALSDARRVA